MIKTLTTSFLLFYCLNVSALDVFKLTQNEYAIKIDSYTNGIYFPSLDSIYIRIRENKEFQKATLAHEVCHYVHFKMTSKYLKAMYKRVYENTNYNPRKYSKKNVRENFADICALMITGRRHQDNHQTRLMQVVLDKPGVKYLIKKYVR